MLYLLQLQCPTVFQHLDDVLIKPCRLPVHRFGFRADKRCWTAQTLCCRTVSYCTTSHTWFCCRRMYSTDCPFETLFAFFAGTQQSCLQHLICSCTQCLLFFPHSKLFKEMAGLCACKKNGKLPEQLQLCSRLWPPVIKPAIFVHFSQLNGGSQCSYVCMFGAHTSRHYIQPRTLNLAILQTSKHLFSVLVILPSGLYMELRDQRIHVTASLFWDVTQRRLVVCHISEGQAKEDCLLKIG